MSNRETFNPMSEQQAAARPSGNDLRSKISGLSSAKRALLQSRLKKIPVSPHEDPFTPRANHKPAPLSYYQELLWLVDQLAPNSVMYTVPRPWRMVGNLNVLALEQTLNTIIARHEVLRTTIEMVDGTPAQVVRDNQTLELIVLDLTGYSETKREAEAQRLLFQAALKPFDLSRDLLLRATLLRLHDQEHILLLDSHHIASDGWSKAVLFKELNELYRAYCTGQAPSLPELPIQYADFAIWQRESLTAEIIDKQLIYWKGQLAGAPALLEFPNARPRPALPTYRGRGHREDFPKSLTDGFKALSRQEGTTLFITFLSAFYTFLHRYTNQIDIVVGTPVAGRNRPELGGMIGYFTNTLALRGDLSGNPTFRQLLQRVRTVALDAYDHQDLPFEKLVLELRPERSSSFSPIFQVMFSSGHYGPQVPELPGLTLSPLYLDRGTARFDLLVGMTECPDRLTVAWEFSTDLFEDASIIQMIRQFRTLLEAIISDPNRPISELPLMTAAEREQLLVEWNQTQAVYPKDHCIHQLFEAQVERTPDAIAVSCKDKQLTYRELNARSNQLAHHLQRHGVGPDILVGIAVESCLEMAVGLLGILKAGGAYVPLDPAYPQQRLRFMMADARVAMLLTQSGLLASLPTAEVKVICLDADWNDIGAASFTNPTSAVRPDNLAYVIYTSGSTGQSKGVQITHRGLVNHNVAVAKQYGLRPHDRILQFSSISFDIAVEELFPTWITGATVVLRPANQLLAGDQFLQWLDNEGITVLDLPTAYWHAWVHDLSALNKPLPSSLRLVIVGGEKVLAPVYRNWLKFVGGRLRWINTYGPTETSVVATVYEPLPIVAGSPDPATMEGDNPSEPIADIPIGRPIANTQAFVLDSKLQPVPVGLPGELVIGGIGLARGYLNCPEQTAEKFIPDPFSGMTGARLYRTGDLVRYRPDGQIEFLGRIDHQVKVRGFRIELGEIEAVLGQHPAVREVIILAREVQPGDKRLVAYVVPNQEQTASAGELRSFAKEKLPEYMVPSAFVILDRLPLTPNGKVDRKALPVADLSGASTDAFLGPRNGFEQQLAMIWERVLGLKSVGVRDNFFEVGGHSLLAVRLLAEIEKIFGQKLPLVALFQATTIEQLAQLLQDRTRHTIWPTVMPVQPGGNKRPIFFITNPGVNALGYAFLARHLGPDQPVYVLILQTENHTRYDMDYVGRWKGPNTPREHEILAATYLKEMRTIQAHGPYLLGGMCEGAHIGFAMARLLQKEGEKVALLALFDAPARDNLNRLWYVHAFFSRLRYYRRRLGALIRLKPDEQWRWLRAKFSPRRKNKPDSSPYVSTLPPYEGTITLFRVDKQSYWFTRDPRLGWGRHTRGGVETYRIPGDHKSFLREPNVQVFVRHLHACLVRVEEEERQERSGQGGTYESLGNQVNGQRYTEPLARK